MGPESRFLDMGVFLGMILGCVTAYVHNRFIDTQFNNAFQIYAQIHVCIIVLILWLLLY